MAQFIDPKAIPYEGFMRTDSPYTPRTVTNPLTEKYKFRWDSKEYEIKPGETKTFPEMIALHGAKHLSMYILSIKTANKVGKENVDVLYTGADIGKVMKEIVDVKTDAQVIEEKKAQLADDLAAMAETKEEHPKEATIKEEESTVRRAS